MTGRSIEPYPVDRPRAATIRSRVMLEVASELVGDRGWKANQAQIRLRSQGAGEWAVNFFGSDSPLVIRDVEAGVVDVAIVNPATAAAPALLGLHPFASAVPLRAIATIPSYDQLGIAVSRDSGVESIEELAGSRSPLRISLRGERPDHAVHMVLDHLLGALGTSLSDLAAAGHSIRYDPGLPHAPIRSAAMAAGEVDVFVDEGVYNWVDQALEAGFRFLAIPEPVLRRLEGMGYRRALIEQSRYKALEEDIRTLDFSGFMIYTHERADEELIASFCKALVVRGDRIPWQGGSRLPFQRMVIDAKDAPVPIPFHPAAEEVWRREGFLPG